jgi:hypothetical protein
MLKKEKPKTEEFILLIALKKVKQGIESIRTAMESSTMEEVLKQFLPVVDELKSNLLSPKNYYTLCNIYLTL